jgi:hypothetical protein
MTETTSPMIMECVPTSVSLTDLQKIFVWASKRNGLRLWIGLPISITETLFPFLLAPEDRDQFPILPDNMLTQKFLDLSIGAWRLALRLTQTGSVGGLILTELTAVAATLESL